MRKIILYGYFAASFGLFLLMIVAALIMVAVVVIFEPVIVNTPWWAVKVVVGVSVNFLISFVIYTLFFENKV